MEFDQLILILNEVNHSEIDELLIKTSKHQINIYLFFKDEKQVKKLQDANDAQNVEFSTHYSLAETEKKLIEQFKILPDRSVLISDEPKTIAHFRKLGLANLTGVGNGQNTFYRNLADDYVENLSAIDIARLNSWFTHQLPTEKWKLKYRYFSQEEELLRETLTTVGNGFIGHRNALSFMKADDDTHYPGTYIAGLFNKEGTQIADRTIYNNDFVNIPNAFLVQFKFDNDTDYWSLDNLQLLDYSHQLNMKNGEVQRRLLLEHTDGRKVEYRCHQLASMQNMHLLGHKISIKPINFSGKLHATSAIDGDIINYGVPRYRKLNSKHFEVKETSALEKHLYIKADTLTSQVNININVFHQTHAEAQSTEKTTDKTAELHFEQELSTENAFELERTIFIETSRNRLENKAQKQAIAYSQIKEESTKAWKGIWEEIDIHISGDRYSQELIRLQLYHLMCSASPNNTKIDTGMTARGLHGEAYRGHIFWDELFILPFYFKHFPDAAKSLMMYRYRRLDKARANARKSKREGALIPWQIADTGEEETQEIHYNPMSGDWDPDLSRKQRHVSIAVAFNVINYYHHTQDEDFLAKEGGEMLLEIVRYWASKVIFDEKDSRYHIYRVMGPDEFHEKYSENPVTDGGIDDNAYTNLMVSWLLKRTIDLLPIVNDETKQKIVFQEDKEKKEWATIASQLYVSIKDNILEQFKGYFNLKDIDFKHYEKEYGDIGRMDRILKSENDSPDNYKVAKQADTLMLFYLLEPNEVVQMIEKLGFEVESPDQLLKDNFDYYISRTSHGSTLSYVVHAFLLDNLPGREKQLWEWFSRALSSDFNDIQGGTTKEGIHCGVMAGNISLIYNCFAGIKMGDSIRLKPHLPDHWENLKLNIHFRSQNYHFEITKFEIKITTDKKHDRSVKFKGKEWNFRDDKTLVIPR